MPIWEGAKSGSSKIFLMLLSIWFLFKKFYRQHFKPKILYVLNEIRMNSRYIQVINNNNMLTISNGAN